MEFYWVNVGATINEVIEGNFLWAPENSRTKSGKIKQLDHWDNVAKVKSGDVIFCCHDKKITHIALAEADAHAHDRPNGRAFSTWGNVGNRVEVSLTELKVPIARDDISNDFILMYDSRCVPRIFTESGTLKQIYMASLPRDAGVYLLETGDALAQFQDALLVQGSNGARLSATTRDAIVKARVGQGRFRSDLLRNWGSRCALTGLSNVDLLVASHIHPWSLSNNDERIDPNNGLLLAAHVDRLFDKGLISFDDEGKLLVSTSIGKADQDILALNRFPGLRRISDGHREFLRRHRRRYRFE